MTDESSHHALRRYESRHPHRPDGSLRSRDRRLSPTISKHRARTDLRSDALHPSGVRGVAQRFASRVTSLKPVFVFRTFFPLWDWYPLWVPSSQRWDLVPPCRSTDQIAWHILGRRWKSPPPQKWGWGRISPPVQPDLKFSCRIEIYL